MTTFKVGDRVRLTGEFWSNKEYDRMGDVVEILSVNEYGEALFDDPKHGQLCTNSDPNTWGSEPVGFLAHGDGSKGEFAVRVREITSNLARMLIEKNSSYSNAALEPIKVFSKLGRIDQINTRIDDKLSRIRNGHEYPGDDTITDLIGYLVLLKMARDEDDS